MLFDNLEIKNYENYLINSNGEIFSKYTNKKMKLGVHRDGYFKIGLTKDGKQTTFQVHRLVALAFIPNPENKPQVNHIDGNKQNNHVSNLEWVTNSENTKHSYDLGLQKGYKVSGVDHEKSLPVKAHTGEKFIMLADAAKWAGLKKSSSITMMLDGRLKSAGKHPLTQEKLKWELL